MTNARESEPPSDDELVSRTLEGDDEAFGAIVERYQRPVFRVARSIVRDEMEADTITQDVFIKAYYNLGKFEQRAGLETWLTRIAINRSRDSLRRRRRWLGLVVPARDGNSTVETEPIDDRPDAERFVLSREIGRAIDRAMDRLSPQQRTILALRHFEQMSLEEIASSLGLRPGTARAHLFRAVHKLRDELSSLREAAPEKGSADE